MIFSLGNAQIFKLKKDASFIENYQIEITAKKNYLFISNNGFVELPFDEIKEISKIKIVDLDKDAVYDLYSEELKIKENELHFSSGKQIEEVVVLGKKNETVIGIDAKGGLMKLFSLPNSSKIVEIPEVGNLYEGKKIKKIRYYFTGGNNTLYDVKTDKMDTRIVPILYTCSSAGCKDKKLLIPEMEVGFTENSKYLEINLSHHHIFIDESFKNLYVGYIALDYHVVKQKRVEKIGNNKCYNNFPELNSIKEITYRCPVISVVIE
ncbi:hypothetical protein [Chryseobacterium sp. 2R14A]|uniref:hypothetical protein n=1 Tax=Chryseobacterium sp. 2R14A TaxID=3380353 RepID=UPI003CF47A3C